MIVMPRVWKNSTFVPWGTTQGGDGGSVGHTWSSGGQSPIYLQNEDEPSEGGVVHCLSGQIVVDLRLSTTFLPLGVD